MSKYDIAVEQAVKEWIAGVMEDPTMFEDVNGEEQFKEKLKSGVILCNLMNKVQPGSIKRFKKNATMPFMQMENIGFFNQAVKSYGVKPEYLFVTVDLFEGKNMTQVLLGLRDFAVVATSKGVKPAFKDIPISKGNSLFD